MQLSAVKGWLNWAGAIGLADTVKYTLYTVTCKLLRITTHRTVYKAYALQRPGRVQKVCKINRI